MGLFSFLFQPSPRITIEHPDFGRMTYHPSIWKKSAGNFRCDYFFKPVQAHVILTIAAGRLGPVPLQADYIKALEGRFNSLTPEIAARILLTRIDENENNFSFDDFDKNFRLTAIHLEEVSMESITCELSFESDLIEDYYFVAVYEDRILKELVVVE